MNNDEMLQLLLKICDFEYMIESGTNFSKYDLESIKKVDDKQILDFNNMFAGKCIPHFFFGNIVNPKKIILGHNPSYSQIFEDLEYLEYRNTQLEGYLSYSSDKYIDLTDEQYDIRNTYKNKFGANTCKDILPSKTGIGNRSTYDWWKDFIFKEDNFNIKETAVFNIKETAVFNLVGYHSYSYENNKIKSKALVQEKKKLYEYEKLKDTLYNDNYNCDYLPTTNMIAQYIKYLLDNNDKIEVYSLWPNYDDWNILLSDLSDRINKDYLRKTSKKEK